MKHNLAKLSIAAADLMARKQDLSASDYQLQMESIIGGLAKHSPSRRTDSDEKELGLVEKMSFEIRTPMNSILGFTGLLQDSFFTIQEKNEFIDLIEKNTQQLIQLLNDLTDLTRIENYQLQLRKEEFELNVFILNLIADFQNTAKEKNITIDKKLGDEFNENICISTDPYQLRHVLNNIIGNVFSYSSGNRVLLNFEIKDSRFLNIQVLSKGIVLPNSIIQSIQKHIEKSEKGNTFDGTGLRLTLTKSLVELLSGDIKFYSDAEIGTGFVIKIPIDICNIS